MTRPDLLYIGVTMLLLFCLRNCAAAADGAGGLSDLNVFLSGELICNKKCGGQLSESSRDDRITGQQVCYVGGKSAM